MSVSAVSRELGEPDNNLWRVFNYYVKKAIDNQLDLSKVKRVAVDEKSQKKGHTYVTIFTDLDEGNVILVKLGRKKEVFEDFKKWLVEKNGLSENIELFSMDMSVSYKAGREEYFPKSEEVFDHFHIKKALNEAVDAVRKEEVKYVDDLKKTKYIWLKSPQRLTEGQERKLNDFLNDSSMETAIAYKMKTAFDQLWKVHPTKAEPLLDNWLKNALISQLKPFVKFVNTVRNNYKGIVKSIKTNITNAIAEGINSKVQIAKSRARGFRSMDSFMAMIYFLGNDFNYNSC
jgi:transposase